MLSEEDEIDIYSGDNKLIELRKSTYGDTKKSYSTFIISAVSTAKRINMYVIEAQISTSCGLLSCNRNYEFNYQLLKTFKFDHAPTSLVEFGDDKIAVAIGTIIKVIDLKGSKEAGLVFEGYHSERIRCLAQISKRTKVKKKIKGKVKKIDQTNYYLISSGSDKMICIWQVPVKLPFSKIHYRMEGNETSEDDEEYCLLNL